jgi:ferredoxin
LTGAVTGNVDGPVTGDGDRIARLLSVNVGLPKNVSWGDSISWVTSAGTYRISALTAIGVDPARIRTELFGGLTAINPGISGRRQVPPHLRPGPASTGPLVTFARSGVAAPFTASWRNMLELAEACDVPSRWSCRTGVCQTCITPLVSGDVTYSPSPLDPPQDGRVLICCAQPSSDVVLDM